MSSTKYSNYKENILQGVEPLLGSDLETENETTCAARQQIFNKQVYAAVVG
jgi:hypothetical protein